MNGNEESRRAPLLCCLQVMVAIALEHLMHAIFGNQPLQGAPPAELPTRNCSSFVPAPEVHPDRVTDPLGVAWKSEKCKTTPQH